MNWLMVKNDFKRNKVINIALLLFMTFSAILAVISVVMAVQTFTSIKELYEVAQPPHFMQMHKGEINQNAIDDFMVSRDEVTYWQTVTTIGVYGDSITVVGKGTYDLSDCRLDIGLVKQNEERDLLLNQEHQRVVLSEGEIGVPVILKGMYPMEIGDKVIVKDNNIQAEFIIKEFVLDSQMNSTMASSTRILLSDADYEKLSGNVGEYEYLIEAYFTDTNMAPDFQSLYEDANLPKNGQAVTYSMIFLLSAITDITTVFILLLVSILLIIISFICVKFTIMAALEEEIFEIGTMKAIGLNYKNIREIYLNKYRILALTGVILGYFIAIMISGIFTKHISTTFGNINMSLLTVVLSLIVAFIVYLLIISYCKKTLNKIKNVTVVDAMVRGNGFEKDKTKIKDGLYKSKKLSVNWLMALREVFYKFKKFAIVFSVVLIAEMLILIPINILDTFEAPEFITYMGSSLKDILIEVENGENLEINYEKTKQILKNDDDIEGYYENRRVIVKTFNVDNEIVNIHIDSGVNSGSDLQYLSGKAPDIDNEIAISYLNADKLGKSTCDKIKLIFNNKEQEFIISGVYQDVTSGGFTAKSIYDFSEDAIKYSFSVNLLDKSNVEAKSDEWSKLIGTGVTVDPMDEFINQTLGGVATQLKTIVLATVIVGAFTAILITVLFLKLRLAKDSADIAILKAIGFSKKDIKMQYIIKIGAVSLTGILAGLIFTSLFGEKFVEAALSVSGLGIKKVELIINPLTQYIIYPVLLMVLIVAVTWIVVKSIDKYNIISIINE